MYVNFMVCIKLNINSDTHTHTHTCIFAKLIDTSVWKEVIFGYDHRSFKQPVIVQSLHFMDRVNVHTYI